jgi:hypothetical protein
MTDRRLRDELRDVFDGISEPAHPALSARIRERLAAGPASGPRTPRLAVALALVAAILVVASLVFVNRHQLAPTTPAGRPTPVPSAAAAPTPSVPPSPASTPTPVPVVPGTSPTPGDGLPAFTCAAQSGGTAPATPVGVATARVAAQSGYDRFVLEFAGPVARYDVTPQDSATFVQDASGLPVALAGSAGLRVVVHGASGQGSFTGPTDLRPAGTAVLREARQVGDFEGVVSWGLGLSRTACFRAFVLTGPNRLVVDVQG